MILVTSNNNRGAQAIFKNSEKTADDLIKWNKYREKLAEWLSAFVVVREMVLPSALSYSIFRKANELFSIDVKENVLDVLENW